MASLFSFCLPISLVIMHKNRLKNRPFFYLRSYLHAHADVLIYRCKLTDHTGQRAPQRAESRRKMNKALNNIPTNSKGYFQVHHFMTKELGLGGAKLLVYALIYSFTVNDGSFFGSRGYICEACGINSLRTVDRVLRELTNEGLLMRLDKVGADCVTYVAVEIKDIGKKCMGKNSTPQSKKCPSPLQKLLTIIKIIIKQTYIQTYMQLAYTRTRKKELRRKLTASRKRGIRELKLL